MSRRIGPRTSFEQLAVLNFLVDASPTPGDFSRLSALARRRGLTAYDTAYLDLAMRLSVPLATADDELEQAAAAEGLEVLPVQSRR